jgi:hypothetical protein
MAAIQLSYLIALPTLVFALDPEPPRRTMLATWLSGRAAARGPSRLTGLLADYGPGNVETASPHWVGGARLAQHRGPVLVQDCLAVLQDDRNPSGDDVSIDHLPVKFTVLVSHFDAAITGIGELVAARTRPMVDTPFHRSGEDVGEEDVVSHFSRPCRGRNRYRDFTSALTSLM